MSSFVFHLFIIFLSFLSVRSIYSSELCLECMLLLSCLECFTMLAVVVSFFPSIWPLFGFQGLRASWMWCQNRWVPNLRRLSSRRQAELTAVSDDGYLNASHTRVAARAAAIFGQCSCTQKCECCDPSGVCAWQPNPLQDYLAQGKTTALCHGICHLSVCWCFAFEVLHLLCDGQSFTLHFNHALEQ